MTASNDAANRAALKILLPHQQRRFRQIELQLQGRSHGEYGVFEIKEFRDALKLTDKQTAQIQANAQRLKEEIEAQTKEHQRALAELRQRAADDLKRVLDDEQFERLSAVHGSPFALPPPNSLISAVRGK